LEPIAYSQNTPAFVGKGDDLLHDGREACDGPTAEVIPITETAGKDNGFNALQVSVFVPELHHVEAEIVA
jgi:hypothetical protein